MNYQLFLFEFGVIYFINTRVYSVHNEYYQIMQTTLKDFYNHENLSPWGRKAYKTIDLGELYNLHVFIPNPKKLNFFMGRLWIDGQV
jgi:hypothetical protein